MFVHGAAEDPKSGFLSLSNTELSEAERVSLHGDQTGARNYSASINSEDCCLWKFVHGKDIFLFSIYRISRVHLECRNWVSKNSGEFGHHICKFEKQYSYPQGDFQVVSIVSDSLYIRRHGHRTSERARVHQTHKDFKIGTGISTIQV